MKFHLRERERESYGALLHLHFVKGACNGFVV